MARRMAVAAILATALLGSVFTAPLRARAAEECFFQSGFCIKGRFLDYWHQHGGLAVNGYPLSAERRETLEDGNVYTVQYFERARFELHPENAAPYDVLLGQFGRPLLRDIFGIFGDDYEALIAPVPSRATAMYFPATGHNIEGRFLAYWEEHGGLAQFGLPLTEPFVPREVTVGGGDGAIRLTVQYFERARLEYHPENAPPEDVQPGQFGRAVLEQVNLVDAKFRDVHAADPLLRSRLGPPYSEARHADIDVLPFERGRMFGFPARMVGGVGVIETLCGDLQSGMLIANNRGGTGYPYLGSANHPQESKPGPRPGLYEPSRAFYSAWIAFGSRECVGYATAPDVTTYSATVQVFERGILLTTPDGRSADALWREIGPNGIGHYTRVALPPR